MKFKLKNVIFAIVAFSFSIFNIYKSLSSTYEYRGIGSFFKLPWKKAKLENERSNKSQFDALFNLNHVPLKTRLAELGRPHNQSEYRTRVVVVGKQERELPFWQTILEQTSVSKVKKQDMFGEDIEEVFFLVVVLQVGAVNIAPQCFVELQFYLYSYFNYLFPL